jgi:hypothetical protein
MTTKEAKATLRNSRSDFPSVVEAVASIARDPRTSNEELLDCLEHGGLATEFAAIELYNRTKRKAPSDPTLFVVDRRDWEEFIAKKANGSRTLRTVSSNGSAKTFPVNGARHSGKRPATRARKAAQR